MPYSCTHMATVGVKWLMLNWVHHACTHSRSMADLADIERILTEVIRTLC